MLATAGELPGDEERWGFEVKWDGIRAVAYLDGANLSLESRNLADITPRYPELAGLAVALEGRAAVLDGEVVAFDEQGRPSFGRLQTRMHLLAGADVRSRMIDTPVLYVLFDVLWLDGEWLTDRPLSARRAVLEELLDGRNGASWQVSTVQVGDGSSLVDATSQIGLEGVVAKRLDSTYELGRRSRAWIKVKNLRRQEFVIGGWVPGEGGRSGRIGALIVGYYDDAGVLHSAGKVGTGFSVAELDRLATKLAALARPDSPFAEQVPDWRIARYVEPELVAEVDYREWTAAGTIRHSSYKGLRDDKPAREVTREP
jgi:bifunctional non-homologous end joining protein LigD